ncbi:actin binding protein [Schizosaccharomyces japonicus yFS275]|uniref:Coronin n=1 Tax=Schizosaccharomyces japonicus (strain yFS275 / FY16936) TaxID=402676 RepID=B6JWA4_SCHJY|nr:actin binding protein [Schizosaccharomyces japonicus yFS275]EEB05655.1 actin binding protein [Schizosaccharomyces japonicus yFS275]
MSGRFVRASKYRHIFGQPCKKELCYDNLRVSKNAWDSNLMSVNPFYLSVNWDAGAGGAFAVIPLEERGKLRDQVALFRGHTSAVLDTAWNPFHDQLLASGGDDSKIMLWRVPDDYSLIEPREDVYPIACLSGHHRKVGHLQYHPTAANVLASASADNTVKLWDYEAGKDVVSLRVKDICQSISFNADGSRLVTTSRDKKITIWDPRQPEPVSVSNGHQGAKNSRAVWLGSLNRIATTGFSKMSDRQLALWDPADMSQPLGGFTFLDTDSGIVMPFWDDGNHVIYLAGKGDGNIRYFELDNDTFYFLSEYKSSDPQRGIAFMPKRGVNVAENEVTRIYKSVHDSLVEPISFIVPRRSEGFQSDIYPPAPSGQPAISAKDWFEGKNAEPAVFDLSILYDTNGLTALNAASTVSIPKSAVPRPKEASKAAEAKPAINDVDLPKQAEQVQNVPEPVKTTTPETQEEVYQRPTNPDKVKIPSVFSGDREFTRRSSETTSPKLKEQELAQDKTEPKPIVKPASVERKVSISVRPSAEESSSPASAPTKTSTTSSAVKEKISGSIHDISSRIQALEKRYEEETAVRDWKIAKLEETIQRLTAQIAELEH